MTPDPNLPPPWESPEVQEALSRAYIPRPITIQQLSSGRFALLQSGRVFRLADTLPDLLTDYFAQTSHALERVRREEAERRAHDARLAELAAKLRLDDDLDLSL